MVEDVVISLVGLTCRTNFVDLDAFCRRIFMLARFRRLWGVAIEGKGRNERSALMLMTKRRKMKLTGH